MKKRLLSWLMVLTLCLTLLPTAAFAAEDAPEQTQPVSEERQENAPAGEQETPAPREEQPAPEEGGEEQPASETKQPAAAPAAENGIATYSGDTHNAHDICGDENCIAHGGKDAEWTAIGTAYELIKAGTRGGDAGIRFEVPGTLDSPSYCYLTNDITLGSDSWTPYAYVVLCLNGHKITGPSGSYPVITVTGEQSKTFTLCDCGGEGQIIQTSQNSQGGVKVEGGTFNLYGGTITRETGVDGQSLIGVCVSSGTFNMYGGAVSGNLSVNGGGVHVDSGGVFNLYDGSIAGNCAGGYKLIAGGGVYVDGGEFNMSGGSITGNYPTAAGGSGGGVYVEASATFTVSGNANISGNKVGSTVADAKTANNVYLKNNGTITVGGKLGEKARIGVADRNLGAVVAVPSSDVTLTESDAAKFVSDSGSYRGTLKDGNVQLASVSHRHYLCGGKNKDTGADQCTGIGHKESYPSSFTELWMDPDGNLWAGNTVLPLTTNNYKSYYELAASSSGTVSYYLGNDLDLQYPLYITKGTVDLCLNGHELKLTQANTSGVDVITLNGSNVELNLTDCGTTGKVTHASGRNGSGVYVDKGTTFNLYNGSITGNTTTGSGAGVYASGTFYMYGGSITGNTATDVGGGVYVNGGTFEMSGNAAVSDNTAGIGGGVSMNGGSLTMSGNAKITGNKTEGDSSSGGGVYVYIGGTFTMTGGSITGNKATSGGNTANSYGGVFVFPNSSKFNVSGNVNITGNKVGAADNNVYLPSNKTITIDTTKGLVDGAKIGVTTQDAPAPGSQIKIATGASENDAQYFTHDAKTLTVSYENSALYLIEHQHSWEYAANGGTITATCNADGCPQSTGSTKATGTVTIAAPAGSLVYDGTAKTATVSSTIGVTPDVTYTKDNADFEGEPTDAGDYTASITLGGVTASVGYTIEKAELTKDDFTFNEPEDLTYTGKARDLSSAITCNKSGIGTVTVSYSKDGEPVESVTDAGTYTFTVSVAEGTNYNVASNLTKDEWKFSVAKADQTITVPTGKTAVHNGEAVDISDWATVAGVDGDTNTGALSYALDGSATGVTLENNQLTVGTGVAADTIFNVKVTAAGMDNYNEKTADFTVTVADKETKTLAVTQTGMTYNGGKTGLVSPTYTNPGGATTTTITYTGKLRDNTEYASTAVKPTQAGTYTVTVKCETEDAFYTGSAQFTIAPIDLGDGEHGVGFSSPQIGYTGKEEPANAHPKGPKDSPEMEPGKDYETSGTTSAINVGKYTVTMKGMGNNYIGEVSGEWEIIPATLTVSGVTAVKTYDGTTTATVTAVSFSGVKGNDTLTASDYAVTEAAYSDANAGTGKTVNGKITLNNTDTAKNYELNSSDFSVSTGEIKQATVSAKENGVLTIVNKRQKTYASELSALLPALPENCRYGEITYGGATLSLTDSIPHTTETHVNSRTGAMTLEVTNLENESTGQIGTITVPVTTTNYAVFNLTVRIDATNKIPPTGTPTLSTMEPTYGQTLSDIRFTTGKLYDDFNQKDVEGTFEWGAPDYKFTAVGDCEARWKFTPKDGETYAEVLGTVIVTVQKATPTGAPAYTAITASGKTLADAALTIGSITPAGGSIAWDLGDGQTVTANTAYRWTYTPAAGDAANYTELTGSITPYVVSYSSGGGSYTPTYPVSMPSKTENGSVSSDVKNASKGSTVTITVKPEDGFKLSGLTVTDKDGNVLKLTDKGNGKYTFTMPAGKVEVKATFAEEIETSPFADVATDAYYYEAVKWAADKGITEGTGNGLFGSNTPCTRAQIVTFLWRAAGSPEPKGTMADMTDVVSGSYYEKAVAWAIENGVTTGTTATTFSPDATCTRAQAVTFLARALNAKASGAAEFSDVPTNSYFAEAVAWAAANGVTEGVGNGMFAPDNDCTRAQIVTFLWRAYTGE